MRREPEYFGEREMDLIYIAKRLKDALRIEDLLTQAGIDYAVETDTYEGGVIFLSQRTGAFFYVLPEISERARQILDTRPL
jgi:predicted amino acid racemase